jgi:hypothetical protein
MRKEPTGYVLYTGPSAIDGNPIVVIAIMHSANTKTGDMIQTYIIRSDMSPIDAAADGSDYSICGNCKHRGLPSKTRRARLEAIRQIVDKQERKRKLLELGELIGRSCYVNLGQGPRIVFNAFKAGKYKRISPVNPVWGGLVLGRSVRIGAYGDPSAVPNAGNFWRAVIRGSRGHTGYTHQHANALGEGLRGIVMASVDSPDEYNDAISRGWRTFRVRLQGQELETGEMHCLMSEEMGYRKKCEDCRLCSGSDKQAKSISIPIHGGTAVMANGLRRLHAIGNAVASCEN